MPLVNHFKNPVLKVIAPLLLFFRGSSVIFFDVKSHSAAFIKILDFRWGGMVKRQTGEAPSCSTI